MAAPKDVEMILSELVRRINEDGRRLRILEEQARTMETRTGSAEDTILRNAQNLRDDLNKIENHFKEFDTRILRLENEITKIFKDIEKSAKKMEIKELENLINLYNPIKSRFVTREEVERMISEK